MFPFVSVVQCPQAEMLERIGPTLVASAITDDRRRAWRTPSICFLLSVSSSVRRRRCWNVSDLLWWPARSLIAGAEPGEHRVYVSFCQCRPVSAGGDAGTYRTYFGGQRDH